MVDESDLDVAPDPPDDVLRAIAAALRAPRTAGSEPGAWWRAGVEESVRDELAGE